MHYVISYDIGNDRSRTRLSELLDRYGTRVNYSVYECELSQRKLDGLIYEIERKKLVNDDLDSLRFYYIHENAVARSFELANRPDPFEREDMTV